MTNQEAFDGIMKWLTRDNGSRCATADAPGAQCLYYDPVTGNRCAIGGHLPLDISKRLNEAAVGIDGILTQSDDDLYDVRSLDLELVPLIRDYYDGVEPKLLDSLQRLHDRAAAWGDNGFKDFDGADLIASDYDLKPFNR